jgi:serine/threonine protein kinase
MTEPSLSEETIFERARQIEIEAERAAFLDRACGADRALQAEVESLPRADSRTGDLLDLPEGPAGERPGAVISPYKLVQELGAGGMSNVWIAEQTHPVRRKVALKIIKAGMDTHQVIDRFQAECQALAMMDHANIAKVFDAGATGCVRSYFVMELVQGVPITTYCGDHRLTPRERLGLSLSGCQAVQHAHQNGIIHRDLKPSNLLVTLRDDEMVPEVINFGIAKATGEGLTERTILTQCGQPAFRATCRPRGGRSLRPRSGTGSARRPDWTDLKRLDRTEVLWTPKPQNRNTYDERASSTTASNRVSGTASYAERFARNAFRSTASVASPRAPDQYDRRGRDHQYRYG